MASSVLGNEQRGMASVFLGIASIFSDLSDSFTTFAGFMI